MNKFLIYISCSLEVEAKDEIEAKEKAEPKLQELENLYREKETTFKVETAKIADKKTGFFV